MNRNDIAGILAGLELTDAQVKGLLDLNSADITKALNRQKDDLTAANDALAKARETKHPVQGAACLGIRQVWADRRVSPWSSMSASV